MIAAVMPPDELHDMVEGFPSWQDQLSPAVISRLFLHKTESIGQPSANCHSELDSSISEKENADTDKEKTVDPQIRGQMEAITSSIRANLNCLYGKLQDIHQEIEAQKMKKTGNKPVTAHPASSNTNGNKTVGGGAKVNSKRNK